jgi:phosphoglycerate-specific signal transduction histidine kinase
VVSCEKVLVGQVILNLAFNAIEEMGDFPRAQARAHQHGQAAPGWRG